MTRVELRPVEADDLPILFEHQADDEAARIASFPSRDREAFFAHHARIAEDPASIVRVVTVDDEVVGNVGSWERDGTRLVGYWIDRAHWGRGIATSALTAFLAVDPARPIHALVAMDNVGSIRVLEKCGFVRTPEHRSTGDGVPEYVYRYG